MNAARLLLPLLAQVWLVASAWGAAHDPPVVDLVIIHANVRTLDPARPQAEAVALAGNRIAALGTSDALQTLAGPGTKIIDAGGRLVLPGFNDAHVHFLSGGFQLSSVDLRDARTQQEFTTLP